MCHRAFINPGPFGWRPVVGESVMRMTNCPGCPVDTVTIAEVLDVPQRNGSIIRTHKLSDGTYAGINSLRPIERKEPANDRT